MFQSLLNIDRTLITSTSINVRFLFGKNCPWHHKNLLGNSCVVRFPSTSVSTMLLNCRRVKIRRILNYRDIICVFYNDYELFQQLTL